MCFQIQSNSSKLTKLSFNDDAIYVLKRAKTSTANVVHGRELGIVQMIDTSRGWAETA